MTPRSDHPEVHALRESAVKRLELVRSMDQVPDRIRRALPQDVFRAATWGYAAGLDLAEVKAEMQEAISLASEVGIVASAKLVAFLRLLGMSEQIEIFRKGLSPRQQMSVGLWAHLLDGERPWLADPPGYPTHPWRREECEFVDRLIDGPSLGSETIASFMQAWVDERYNDGNLFAYEVAALAQMHSVDDSALSDHPYYPYGLVHGT